MFSILNIDHYCEKMRGFDVVIVFMGILVLAESDVIFKNNNIRSRRQSNNGCVLPPKPNFGDWQVINGHHNPGDTVPLNSVVKFSCIDGYKLDASPLMICGVQWDVNNIPQCKQICEALTSTSTTTLTCADVHGNEVGCDKVIHDGTLVYECKPYYEVPPRSPKQLFCQDGVWSSSKPICEPVCGNIVASRTAVPAVAGGTKLSKIKYPWIVAIYGKDEDTNDYVNICGGNIIARRLVLTAAHCVANDYGDALQPSKYKVAAAKLYNKFEDPRDTNAEYLNVESIIVHPGYKGSSRRFVADLALIITKTLFTLGPLIQPVCLRGVTEITLHAAYDKGEIAGWGLTETNQPSNELQFLEIPYKDQGKCERELPPDFLEKFKYEDKICAGFFNKSISICRGDSGSGLAFRNQWDDGRYYVHGIVSITAFSGDIDKCNLQQNSLYTKVAYYYLWIEKYVMKYQVEEECQLPPHPKNGRYTVENDGKKKPGDSISPNDWLNVTCKTGYRPVSSRLTCKSANNNTLQCQRDATINIDPLSLTNHKNFKLLPQECGRHRYFKQYESPLFEFPWQVQMGLTINTGTQMFKCSGTILNEQYVLTAAHCISNLSEPLIMNTVIIGEYDPSAEFDCAKISFDIIQCTDPVRISGILEALIYPGYNATTLSNDIGLLRITPLTFNINVGPICLPLDRRFKNASFKRGTVTGWTYDNKGVAHEALKKTKLTYMNNEDCQAAILSERNIKITRNHICAWDELCGSKNYGGEPLQVFAKLSTQNESVYVQYGVVSYFPKRCGVPIIFTRVSYYVDWILDSMKP